MAVIEGIERRIVGGVDTHKDLHVAAVVDEQDRVLGTHSFATTRQRARSRSKRWRSRNGLALGKWRALLKERGAFHGQAAATVREGI
jgi:hypothetical protein